MRQEIRRDYIFTTAAADVVVVVVAVVGASRIICSHDFIQKLQAKAYNIEYNITEGWRWWESLQSHGPQLLDYHTITYISALLVWVCVFGRLFRMLYIK